MADRFQPFQLVAHRRREKGPRMPVEDQGLPTMVVDQEKGVDVEPLQMLPAAESMTISYGYETVIQSEEEVAFEQPIALVPDEHMASQVGVGAQIADKVAVGDEPKDFAAMFDDIGMGFDVPMAHVLDVIKERMKATNKKRVQSRRGSSKSSGDLDATMAGGNTSPEWLRPPDPPLS
ncbi:hypothetical protein AMTR_s00052p00161010 [Amborella trichopoda]|uniref:Uncharacterized protein n=1 Tax=Amborella trichopoda TaxID=13333 RepID=U5D7S6_AMBTC|nr:hypothetical protein AMTR_s00052p00161010 [Amborella trichopoda]